MRLEVYMKAMVYAAGLMAVVVATPSLATELSTFEQQISYSIGYKMGKSLKAGQGELKLDLDVVKEAITDVMDDKPLKLTEDQMKAAFKKLQEERQAKAMMGK
jgi:FKBP-type peptidyl-prolyl cis-trans isomerase